MVYAVQIFDSRSGLEKIVTVEARTPEDAYRNIEKLGYRIVRVAPAQPGLAAGVVMNPSVPAPDDTEASETPEVIARRKREDARAAMIHQHNLLTLWPMLPGAGLILWGLFQWLNGDGIRALVIATIGAIVSILGALRRWTQDQGPWR